MRENWNKYFLNIAIQVSSRGTCDRKQCGCVMVRDRQILSTGYNGSMPKVPHCDEAGHLMVGGHCVRTIHAERNAINQAAKHGTPLQGASAYITHSPCWECYKNLVSVEITHIYYGEEYGFQWIKNIGDEYFKSGELIKPIRIE